MPAKLAKPKKTEKKDITSIISPVAEDQEGMCMLFYGRSGTGKTTLLATFPTPVLIVDLKEKGTDSVYNVPGLDRARVRTWSEIEDLYWYLKSGEHKYKSVGLDTLTQMQEMAQIQALKENKKEISEPMTKREWGIASGLMKTWIINYRDLIEEGLNVAFVAQDRTSSGDDDDDGGDLTPEVGPRLMPSVAGHANAAVKVIGHTFIKEKITRPEKGKLKVQREILYGLRVGPHAIYTTKIRVPKNLEKPDIIYDPSFNKIVAVIRGRNSVKSGPTKKG